MSRIACLALFLTAAPLAAQAACFADYKAKREPPLRLHYGVIALPDTACASRAAAAAETARRLRAEGWELLDLMALFGPEGLAERQADAGAFYLRY